MHVSSLPRQYTIRTVLFLSLLLLSCGPATQAIHAQQKEVPRYDAFAGFTSINAPALGLSQPGFHTQAGINMRPWYSVGFDFSIASGSEVLKTDLLPPSLQQTINGGILLYKAMGLLPASYVLAIPTDAFTQTYAAGPQLLYRHYDKFSLFLRPSLGALHETATPHPVAGDFYAAAVVQQLAPTGKKADWTGFYGLGGGGDYAVTRHIGIRAQMDAVYNDPFNDILENGRWTYRFSVGPSFHFGHNIVASRTPSSHAAISTPAVMTSAYSSSASR